MSSLAPNQPLSYLTLERYLLDEVDAHERALIESRLAQSPEDRACLAALRDDASELPPLPAWPATKSSPKQPAVAAQRRSRGVPVFAALALAAAALFVWLPREPELPAARRAYGTKGGELALQLVSDLHGENPRSFAAGERFKALVTCPPELTRMAHLLVFQAGHRYEPLAARKLVCGNLVAMPGAFVLDGEAAADVCMSFSEPLAVSSAQALGEDAVCTRLTPR